MGFIIMLDVVREKTKKSLCERERNLFHNDKMKSRFESWAELFSSCPRTCRIVTVECLSILYDCRCHGSQSLFLCCHSYSEQENCTTCVAAVKVNFCPNSATLVWLVDGKVHKGCYVHGIFLGGRTIRWFHEQFLESFGKPYPNQALWNFGKVFT